MIEFSNNILNGEKVESFDITDENLEEIISNGVAFYPPGANGNKVSISIRTLANELLKLRKELNGTHTRPR